jgi:hypothetical protein
MQTEHELKKFLTNGETSNTQLILMAQRVGIPLKKICFKDQLFDMKAVPGAYILNLQNERDYSPMKPSHWVGMFLPSSKKAAYYFDSYGQPFPEIVAHFAKKNGYREVVYSREEIQPISSNYCGQFVIDWLYFMTHKEGPFEERYQEYLRQFKSIRQF